MFGYEYWVAEPSGLAVFGHSLAGIAGSDPAGSMGVCILWVLCVVRYWSLRRADHSSRGVLPSVCVCVCVCVSECHRETPIMMRPWPTGSCCAMKRRKNVLNNYSVNVITLNSSGQFKLKLRREYLMKLFCCYTDVIRWTQCAVWSLSLSGGNRIHAMTLTLKSLNYIPSAICWHY